MTTYLLAARQIGIVHQDQFTEVKLIRESLSFGLMQNLLIVVISVNNRTVFIFKDFKFSSRLGHLLKFLITFQSHFCVFVLFSSEFSQLFR